jgi:hypothetical protein
MEEIIKLLRVLFLCCLISCNSQKNPKATDHKSISLGKYVTNNLYKLPNYEEVVLLNNYKVSYNLQYENYGSEELKGTWKFRNDTLKLFFKIPKQKSSGEIQIAYGKEKKKTFDVNVNDEFGLLFGSKLFINDTEYLVNSKDIKIESQFIENIKILYEDETYEMKVNKFVDKDIILLLEHIKYISSVYDFITTTWVLKENKLYKYSDGQLNQNIFLVYAGR